MHVRPGVVRPRVDEADDARLRPAVHHEAVDVEPRRVVLGECTLGDERGKALGPGRVHGVRVLVRPRRQVDLRADDVQERLRVPRS